MKFYCKHLWIPEYKLLKKSLSPDLGGTFGGICRISESIAILDSEKSFVFSLLCTSLQWINDLRKKCILESSNIYTKVLDKINKIFTTTKQTLLGSEVLWHCTFNLQWRKHEVNILSIYFCSLFIQRSRHWNSRAFLRWIWIWR